MKSAGTTKKRVPLRQPDEPMAALKAALKNGRRAIRRAQQTADRIERQLGDKRK